MFSNEGLGVQGMIGGQQKGQAKAGGHDYSTAGRRRVWASRTQINGLRQRAARGEGGSQYLTVTLTLTSESVYGSQFFHRKLLQVLMS